MRPVKILGVGALAILLAAAWVQPAVAVQFTWSQNGGFEFGTGTLRAGQFFGLDSAPVAGHGGLEYFGLQAAPAPANTYRVIGWGCPPDGNNDGAIAAATCANAGVVAEAVTVTDPSTNPGRSSLVLDTFDSTQSGVLDSQTGANVVIARISHINNVIDDEANALSGVTISANLIVDAVPPVSDPNSIPIGFLETINIGACSQTPNPLGSQCDDEFTFDASEFANVPFTHNGESFFLQFSLAPPPECDTPHSTIGTIQIFQCDDDPAHRIAIDFANGRAWAMEGFDNALLVLMRVTEEQVGVPAPAGLILMGLGFVAVALSGRRRRTTEV
jgi:hypothetical protein